MSVFSQAISQSLQGSLNHQKIFMTFDQYKISFGKNYATKQEETLRRNSCKKNLKLLKTLVSQSWGVNNFTDGTASELQGIFFLKKGMYGADLSGIKYEK